MSYDDWSDSQTCLGCGDIYLHCFRLDAWFRKEDADTPGVRIDFEHPYGVPVSERGNPSPRRDGFKASFRCEDPQCGTVTVLKVRQHKGHTVVTWDAE